METLAWVVGEALRERIYMWESDSERILFLPPMGVELEGGDGKGDGNTVCRSEFKKSSSLLLWELPCTLNPVTSSEQEWCRESSHSD